MQNKEQASDLGPRQIPFRNAFGFKLLFVIVSSSVYGLAFIPLHAVLGSGGAATSALPVAAIAWVLGFRMGVLAGLIAFPMNIMMFNIVGETGWDVVIRSGGAAGSVVIPLIGGIVGKIRDLRESLKEELAKGNRLQKERDDLISELQVSLSEVKTLSGMIPICASCKRVRQDDGYWASIERYIRDHSDAELSHSICPKCLDQLYPGLLS